MFILDKHLQVGYATIDWTPGWKVNFGEQNPSRRTSDLTSADHFSNVREFFCSGQSYYTYGPKLYGIDVSMTPGNNNGLHWNRMADGALVMDRVLAVCASMIHPIGNVDFNGDWGKTEGPSFGNGTGNYCHWFSWKRTITDFGGAPFVIKVVRTGTNSSEQASDETQKYVYGSGDRSDETWNAAGSPAAAWTDARLNASGSACGAATASGRSSASKYPSWSSGYTPRLIAIPTGSVPTITPMETSLGVITEPTTVPLSVAYASTVTVYVDGSQKSQQTGQTSVSVNLSTYWDELSLGSHEVTVTAEANGYKTGARIRFAKSTSMVSAMGKPQSFGDMPTMCYMADNLTVPANATAVREVCNNGNDADPTWEVYEGDGHHFSNDQKTATDWALNWRIGIDNSLGTSQARINTGVNMGVLVKGGAGPKEQE